MSSITSSSSRSRSEVRIAKRENDGNNSNNEQRNSCEVNESILPSTKGVSETNVYEHHERCRITEIS